MKPTIFTHKQTCIITENNALSGQGGSLNQNAHTPFSGGCNSFARSLQSAVTTGLWSRLGMMLIFLMTSYMIAAQTVINEGDVFTVDNIHYKVTKYGVGKINAVSVCNGGFSNNGYYGQVIIPERVTYGTKIFEVTAIYDEAFINCNQTLDSVFIPVSIERIGKRAFKNCTRLRNMTVPNSVTSIGNAAFYNCNIIKTVTLSNALTTISDSLFYRCYRLLYFQLPEKITTIGKAAFYETFTNYYSLKTLVIPDKVTFIGEEAFSGCKELSSLTLPNSVTTVGPNAFYNCSGINNVQLSNALTAIPGGMFSGCSSIRNVIVHAGVQTIGAGAFYGCTSLAEVVLPEGLTTIGVSAFNTCTNLTTLNLPASVTQLHDYAFAECYKLAGTMTIPKLLTTIGKQAFRKTDVQLNVHAENKNFSSQEGVLLNKLKSVVIHCPTSKTTFSFPNTVKKIEEYAFSKSKITQITLPGSLDTIARYAFENSSSLTHLTLPASIEKIGDYAFNGCTALQRIRAYMENPPQITPTVLGSVPATCELQVLIGSLDLYKAANGWKNLNVISFGGAVGTVLNSNGIYYRIVSETEAKVIAHPNGNQNYTGQKAIPASFLYQDVSYDVISIDKSAFAYSGVTSVTIPTSVKYIGEWAFTNCQYLNGITIPDGVTFIGQGAFANCSLLTTVVLSNTLTSIENALFQSCPALTNLMIPASVLSIGEYAFDQCYGLITMVIPNSVTQIGKWAFQLCTELQGIQLSDNVEVLPDYVFWQCEALQEVKLPASLKEIGREAFYNCSELSAVELPAGLVSIGESAFYKAGLTVISLPSKVNFIGSSAFASCYNLKDVYAYNRTPVGITRDVFSDIYHYHLNLFVRSRSIPLYQKTAVWKDLQIKSIESIHTNTIRELTGREIVVNVNTLLVEEEDKFTAFQFEMKYDTLRMIFRDYSTDNLMTASGSVMVNSNTKGILKVGYMSNNTLSGEGTLIKLRFKIRNSGIVEPVFNRFLYNAYDLANFSSGAIEVIAYGDVDYNQEVQSYDASLVLINSVGLNPISELDSYPWSALRNDVSDVDASATLTALDAGLILRKSVDLLDKFPVEVPAVAPVKRQNAPEKTDKTDVLVALENNQLIFKSYGDLIGLNVDIQGEIHLLEMPQVHASLIQARNIHELEYKVALAAASMLPAGTTIMTIPLKDELEGDLILTMNVNGVEKVITINSSSTGINDLDANQVPVYLNEFSGELLIHNHANVRTIDIYCISGNKIFSQKLDGQSVIKPNNLNSGVYLVVLTSESGSRSTTKILKK